MNKKIFQFIILIFLTIFAHENNFFSFPHFKFYLDPVYPVFTFKAKWSKSTIFVLDSQSQQIYSGLLATTLVELREKNFVAGPAMWNFFMSFNENTDAKIVEQKLKYIFCKNAFELDNIDVLEKKAATILLISADNVKRYKVICD